jgi:hypothetical protein
VGKDLQRILQPLGYAVEVTEGEGEALIDQTEGIAIRFRPHVAIVDLRLLDDYSTSDQSGLRLLEVLQSASCILYSAYLTPEITREAIKRYHATTWISKSESPQRLVAEIGYVSKRKSACWRGLIIKRPSALTSQYIIKALLKHSLNPPPEIVDDVLCQLFPDYLEMLLEPVGGEIITPNQVSRGRSVVVKVQSDEFEPVVVKFSLAERIQSEQENYKKHVKNRLVGQFYAHLEHTIIFWELGAAVYSFLGSSLKTLPSFTVFYRKETDPKNILQPLRHFFRDVWSRHFNSPSQIKDCSMFQIYDQSLDLTRRLRTFNHINKIRSFPGLSTPLINPVYWVLAHADDGQIAGVREVVTHGDLHGDNLFVNGEHAWAIDFERTGLGHILRDFVELEVDIITRLLSLPLPQFFKFVIVIAEPSEPTASFHLANLVPIDPAAVKAFDVVVGLRKLAYEVTRYSDAREYFWGLMLDALFAASVASEDSPQRDRALLLASVLCSRLRYWGKKWPPDDWL